jgi:DNA-binding NtrC family response regulator
MKKIAVVDDEQDILNILNKFFSRKKLFDVDTFVNPQDAIDNIKIKNYDLVLTDIMMPQIDGIELLRQIKDYDSSIKVIMMTAYSTLDKTLESEKLGASDYITKPFISLKDVENKILDNLEI